MLETVGHRIGFEVLREESDVHIATKHLTVSARYPHCARLEISMCSRTVGYWKLEDLLLRGGGEIVASAKRCHRIDRD